MGPRKYFPFTNWLHQPRSPGYHCLDEAVRILYAVWIMTAPAAKGASPTAESLALIYSRVRQRTRKVLERLFRAQSGEVLESLIECWNRTDEIIVRLAVLISFIVTHDDGNRQPNSKSPALSRLSTFSLPAHRPLSTCFARVFRTGSPPAKDLESLRSILTCRSIALYVMHELIPRVDRTQSSPASLKNTSAGWKVR